MVIQSKDAYATGKDGGAGEQGGKTAEEVLGKITELCDGEFCISRVLWIHEACAGRRMFVPLHVKRNKVVIFVSNALSARYIRRSPS